MLSGDHNGHGCRFPKNLRESPENPTSNMKQTDTRRLTAAQRKSPSFDAKNPVAKRISNKGVSHKESRRGSLVVGPINDSTKKPAENPTCSFNPEMKATTFLIQIAKNPARTNEEEEVGGGGGNLCRFRMTSGECWQKPLERNLEKSRKMMITIASK